MKPKFSTLIVLILLAAVLLTPFAFSPVYLPWLRDRANGLYTVLLSPSYKILTGFVALGFVLLALGLTAKKRSRLWPIKISGSIQFWRRLHIFIGVGLLGTVLVHTGGSQGFQGNAVLLWVLFGVVLSALVGNVTEAGLLEAAKSGLAQNTIHRPLAQVVSPLTQASALRWLRKLWLGLHILLVCLFIPLLGFHIVQAFI